MKRFFYSTLPLVLLSSFIQAQSITNVSNQSGEDTLVTFFDTYIAWQHFDGNDNEIFLYNTSTGIKTQVTDNSTNDSLPHLGSGYFISASAPYLTWLHWDGNDYEVAYCATDNLSTLLYATNDNIDQEQPLITFVGILWTEQVGAERHVKGYYNSSITDISANRGLPVANCPSCGLHTDQGRPFWSSSIGSYTYPNTISRAGASLTNSYGYCVDNTTAYTGHYEGLGIVTQTKEGNGNENSEVMVIRYANNFIEVGVYLP